MNDRLSTADIPGIPAPYRPYYSNAVRVAAGDLLFISGQVAWDENGQLVGAGDGAAQSRQAFGNLGKILDAYGATFDDVVKVTVYVTDFSFFDELSALRQSLWRNGGPASAILLVSGLVQPELLVEVEAVAAIG